METNYEQTAIDFAERNNIKFQILETSYGKHFSSDTQSGYIFKCKLSHGRKSYTFNFGQSIANGAKEPNLYSVLACLQKNDVYQFQDFCDEFGYEANNENYTGKNKVSLRIYNSVVKEWNGVERVFEHCLDELREIQ